MLSIRPYLIYFLFGTYFIIHLTVYYHFGAQFVDDAYITFRYAERMASGLGFTFNNGELVLGTTTPLWTLLIACCFLLRIPLELGIAILTSAAASCMCVAIWSILSRQGQPLLGMLGGLSLLVYERYLFGFLMGMESIAYLAVVFVVLAMLLRGRYRGIGFLCAMAFLIRPDGLVLAVIGIAVIARHSRRLAAQESLFFILPLVPWIAFCLAAFGSVVPHSIAAKQLIHPSHPLTAALSPWTILLQDRFFLLAFIFALPGVIMIVARQRNALPLPVWLAAYALGLGASRIQVGLFPWYFIPLIGATWLLGLIGMGMVGNALHSAAIHRAAYNTPLDSWKGQILPIVLLIAVLFQSRSFLERNWAEFPASFIAKERYYESAARDLARQIRPGESVLVGEVGVFAYFLKQATIIDSSGINSPAVHAIRKESSSGRQDSGQDPIPKWVLNCIEQLKPDWIVSLPQFLGARAMLEHRERIADYAPVGAESPASPNQLVVLKRENAKAEVR